MSEKLDQSNRKIEVFFISTKYPFPPDDGQKIPLANYILELKKRNIETKFILAETSRSKNKTVINKVYEIVDRLNPFSGFYSNEIIEPTYNVKLVSTDIGYIFVSPARLIKIVNKLKHVNKNLKIVLLLNDAEWPMYVESLMYGLHIRPGGNYKDLIRGLLTPITIIKELRAYRYVDCVVLQTERERKKLPWLKNKTIVAMNAINHPQTAWIGDRDYIFTMQVNFNTRRTDKWKPFLTKVWPEIKKQNTKLELELFGPANKLPTWMYGIEGVRYVGVVEDLDKYLASCRALIMPLDHGTGVSNTILRGIALDMPMIISNVSSKGVSEYIERSGSVFIAKTKSDYVYHTRLLLDKVHMPQHKQIGNWTDNLDRIFDKLGVNI